MKRIMIIMNLLLLSFCVTACNMGPSESGNYYSVYTAKGEDDSYEITGKAHVEDTLSVLYVTCTEKTSLTISGELKDISGNIQIAYVNEDDEDTIIAEKNDLNKNKLEIDTSLPLDEGEGCIEFRGDHTSFDVQLLFENLDHEKIDYYLKKGVNLNRILNEGTFTYTNNENDCTVMSTAVSEKTKVKVKVTAKISSIDAESRLVFNGFRLSYYTEDGGIVDAVEYTDKAIALGGYSCQENFETELELPEGTNELILNNEDGKNYKITLDIKVIGME